MINLFKQFFSFKKLMKDRLVASFFYLGLVVVVMSFLGTLLASFTLISNGAVMTGLSLFFVAFFKILFAFVCLRLISEIMVSIFNIKDSLAADGGKSDTADIDVFETAKDAVTKAAKSTSTATRSVIEKGKTKLAERGQEDGDGDDEHYNVVESKPKAKQAVAKKTETSKQASPKKSPIKKTAAVKKPAAKKTTVKKTAIKKKTVKKKPIARKSTKKT